MKQVNREEEMRVYHTSNEIPDISTPFKSTISQSLPGVETRNSGSQALNLQLKNKKKANLSESEGNKGDSLSYSSNIVECTPQSDDLLTPLGVSSLRELLDLSVPCKPIVPKHNMINKINWYSKCFINS